MASVYVHINKLNGKKYFGRTDVNAITRWGNKGIGYKGQKFYKEGIEQFGWDNFYHKILVDDITSAQSIALETFLILEYDSINQGYNEIFTYCTDSTLKEIASLGKNLKNIIDNLKEETDGSVLGEESLDTLTNVGYTTRNTGMTLRVIQDLWKNGKIFTELDIQRGLVWTEEQQQELWDTLLYGERIPEVHARLEPNGNYSMMDGKQRISYCMLILDNKIPCKISTLRNEKHRRWCINKGIKALNFSDFPESVQEKILLNIINFALYENMSDEDMASLFKKLNFGTKLNNYQKTISQNFIFRKNILLPIIIQNDFLQNLFSDSKNEKNEDEFFVLKTLYLFCIENEQYNNIGLKQEDTQKLINYIEQSPRKMIAIQQLSQLFIIFQQLNITPKDFERENKRTKDNRKRINDSIRPFIFLIFNNNLDKKDNFKNFLKQAIFNDTTPADRMTAPTVLKFYHMVKDEFNRVINN